MIELNYEAYLLLTVFTRAPSSLKHMPVGHDGMVTDKKAREIIRKSKDRSTSLDVSVEGDYI